MQIQPAGPTDPDETAEADAAELQRLTQEIPQNLTDEDFAALEAVNDSIAANGNDEAYATALFEALGPRAAAHLPTDLAAIAADDYARDLQLDTDVNAIGENLSVALGTATRSGDLDANYVDTLRDNATAASEAVYLSAGTFEPNVAADWAEEILTHHHPHLGPGDQAPIDGPGIRDGGQLFGFEPVNNQASWAIASDAVIRSGAENHLLRREGIAERLLDPDLDLPDEATHESVARLLDGPRQSLEGGAFNTFGVDAAANLVEATVAYEGKIADHADEAIAGLYVDHPDAIHNLGRDASRAWRIDSPLERELHARAEKRALGDSEAASWPPAPLAGSASDFIAAAVGADGVGPNGQPWGEEVLAAAYGYQSEILSAGPRDNSTASAIVWGDEVARLDREVIEGFGRRAVIDGEIEDDRNAMIRRGAGIVTSLLPGAAKALATEGSKQVVGWSARAVGSATKFGIGRLLPTDNADRAANDAQADLLNGATASQYKILDAAISLGHGTRRPLRAAHRPERSHEWFA